MEDTLNPRWKDGKISVRAAHSGFIPMWPLWKKDRQKAIEYIKRLAKQDVLPEKRTSVVTKRISNGECPIGLPRVSDVYRGQKKGAPIAPCPMPAVAYPTGIWIPKGGVKHPHAAKLFMAWMLTPEGKNAVVKAGRGRLAPAGASLTARWLAHNGIDLVRIESKEDIRIYNQDFAKTVITLMGLMPKK